MKENSYPMLGYVYTREGYYGEPVRIPDDNAFVRFMANDVARAFVEKRQVRITDRTADDLLFHLENGKVKWSGGGSTEEAEQALQDLATNYLNL
jgi:hypothetical protein